LEEKLNTCFGRNFLGTTLVTGWELGKEKKTKKEREKEEEKM